MEKLIAKRAVLYQGRQYEPGEPLPAYDPTMVDAWLRAGTAKMVSDAKLEETPAGDNNGQNGQDDLHGGQPAPEMVDGHLDPAQLASMSKEDLERLAKDMGVDLPRGAAKALIVEKLAAVTVQAPVNDGRAQ